MSINFYGDWGLGDWPNPQSPNPQTGRDLKFYISNYIYY